MPLKNRLSRMMRKSGSSGSSSDRSSDGHAESYNGSSSTSVTTPSMPSTPVGLRAHISAHSRLSKRTTWLSNLSVTSHDGVRSFATPRKLSPKRSAKPSPKGSHPNERHLTEQNLCHQEILGMFTMKFGRSRGVNHDDTSIFSGISPCHSRPASLADMQDLVDDDGQHRIVRDG